jgi:hypothetical protein
MLRPWLSKRTFLGGGVLLLLSGCPDTQGDLDDFVNQSEENFANRPDAAPMPDGAPISGAQDITGTYLLSVAPFGDPTRPLLFRAEVTATVAPGGAGTFEMVLVPVETASKAVMTGNRIPASGTITGGTISAEGALDIDLGTVVVPGAANALSGSEIEATLRLIGRTPSEDEFCGDLQGTTQRPAVFELTGSTFGVTKVADDTMGDNAAVSAAAAMPVTNCRPGGDMPGGGGMAADAGM